MNSKKLLYYVFVFILITLLLSGCGPGQIFGPTITPTPTPTPIPTNTPVPTPTSTPELFIGSTQVSPKDGMTLLYVPAGDFSMGSNGGAGDEMPVHTVYLDPFWIDQTEVTNEMYFKCVVDGQCKPPTDTYHFWNSSYASHPVVYVDWFSATAYCSWAGRRLPSEAEWEKAARGPDHRILPWGEDMSCDKANFYFGTYCVGDTTKVGSYESGKSPYGAYDMAGNAWEWVNDWYDIAYYSNSPSSNPLGPDAGEFRVMRGGSWSYVSSDIRSTYRLSYYNFYAYNYTGFRCARSMTP